MAVFCIMKGAPLILAPFSGNVYVFDVLYTIHGFARGFTNTGKKTHNYTRAIKHNRPTSDFKNYPSHVINCSRSNVYLIHEG